MPTPRIVEPFDVVEHVCTGLVPGGVLAPVDTLYTYDLAGHLIAETHSYGVYKRAYVYLHEWPVAMLFQSDD